MQINLTAILKSLPEKTEEMKVVLLELVESSIKEDACLQYELHRSTDEPNVFIFHEIWRDRESLDAHNNTPHVQKFLKESEGLLFEKPGIYLTNRIA